MKKTIIIILVSVALISVFLFSINYTNLKPSRFIVTNVGLKEMGTETVKAVDTPFAMKKIPKLNEVGTIGIFYDTLENNLNYLIRKENGEIVLTVSSLGGKASKTIHISPEVKNKEKGKVIFGEDKIYIGLGEHIYSIVRSSGLVEDIVLPKEKLPCSEELLPSKEEANNHDIIDIANVGHLVAISRNNSYGVMLFDPLKKSFDEIKLPQEFGTVNKIIPFDDSTIFITNFYSGKGGYLIKDQFAKLNLKTKTFYVFNQPVQKLFIYNGKIWGVDLNGKLFTLDDKLEQTKSYDFNTFVATDIVPSKDGIWFVGADTDPSELNIYSNVSDEPPSGNSFGEIGLPIKKQIFFIGCFKPEDHALLKSYLPVYEPTHVYGGPPGAAEKVEKLLKSRIVIPTGIISLDKGGVLVLMDGFYQFEEEGISP